MYVYAAFNSFEKCGKCFYLPYDKRFFHGYDKVGNKIFYTCAKDTCIVMSFLWVEMMYKQRKYEGLSKSRLSL